VIRKRAAHNCLIESGGVALRVFVAFQRLDGLAR
jgi:hypothetical protein